MKTLAVILQDQGQTWQMDTMEGIEPFYVVVDDWSGQLSPWPAKGVFKNQTFTGGADAYLKQLEAQIPQGQYDQILICGYSLAGLFALYACTKSNRFDGCVCASGSLWFQDFLPYLKQTEMHDKKIYLSLGDTEKNSKNPILKTIEDCTQAAEEILKEHNQVIFHMRPGGHFVDEKPHVQEGIISISAIS